ncbi:zinc ABC transporter substrate-binding protein [Sneathiella sp.]|uniref:zinc ABC transporter substrate-binding protein n=1 Tax=Sneathiella sp. TaxID=1964365 RepID=UPI003567C6B9
MRRLFAALLTLFLASGPAAAAETGDVVVTLKPLHSLVQGVMGDTGEAVLLVNGIASPHGFSLKPSQIRALQKASVVFYVDEAMETFLDNALAALPPRVRRYAFAEKAGIDILPLREGGAWDAHHHEDVHHHGADHHNGEEQDHAHGEDNLHVWLAIGNAQKMVAAIAAELTQIHPENKAIYAANAAAFEARLVKLDAALEQKLAPVRARPFVVFHDAYAYFERAYGLTAVGSITIDPDQPPSARRLQEIREKITAAGAVCLFREPQFDDKLVRTVAEGLPIRLGTLDPLGIGLQAGPALYGTLMTNLASDLVECLAQKG